jgi:hypothetical protein
MEKYVLKISEENDEHGNCAVCYAHDELTLRLCPDCAEDYHTTMRDADEQRKLVECLPGGEAVDC